MYKRQELEDVVDDGLEVKVLAKTVKEQFSNYAKLNRKIPAEILNGLQSNESAKSISDVVASNLTAKVEQKQELLATGDIAKRLEKILAIMDGEINALQVERKVRNRVKRQMEKSQRDYYLNEQMKAIQRELGESDDDRDEVSELENKIKRTKLSKEARIKACLLYTSRCV